MSDAIGTNKQAYRDYFIQETVEAGIMTGDLLLVADRNPQNRKVNTGAFIDAIAANLQKKLYA